MDIDSAQRRWVEFADIDNIRDLGGLAVATGGRTRFGVVFRSGTPQQCSAADLARLIGPLGLRTVIDLRNPEEMAREGHGRLSDAGVRLRNLPVRKVMSTAATPAELAAEGATADLAGLYRELLSGSARSVVEVVRVIADTERHSVVFHCAAGKDRTGIVAAVLLDALGVPHPVIVDDYALSAERMARIRERLNALPSYRGLPPVGSGILFVDPRVMAEFLAELHTVHGGGAAWLLSHGLSRTELDRLRAILIER